MDRVSEKKLYTACLKGDVEALEALMREDELVLARVSISSCFNETPLHIAAMLGHFEFAKTLIHYKPDFASRLDSQGRSPLHLASANGYAKIAKLLSQEDPDQCLVPDEVGRTPLHLAVMNGQLDTVRQLLEAKPEASQYTWENGETILHFCVVYNRLKVLIVLINSITIHDDFINVKDNSGSTILHMATALKRTQLVKYLLTNEEVKVNEVNGDGLTALDITEHMPKDVDTMEIKELLISAGALRAKANSASTSTVPVITGGEGGSAAHVEQPLPAETDNNKSTKLLKKKKNFNIFRKLQQKGDKSLLVAASVIAAMAFQAAISPPGGVIGLDAQAISTNNPRHEYYEYDHPPGKSVLACFDTDRSNIFWILNTISLVASLSVIFIFVSGLSIRRKILIWLLRAATWIMVSAMALAYVQAVATITPQQDYDKNRGTFIAISLAVYIWVGLIGLSFLILFARLIWIGLTFLILFGRLIIHTARTTKRYIQKTVIRIRNTTSQPQNTSRGVQLI